MTKQTTDNDNGNFSEIEISPILEGKGITSTDYLRFINEQMKGFSRAIDKKKDTVTYKSQTSQMVEKEDNISMKIDLAQPPQSIKDNLKTMLQLAAAKGWDIKNLKVTGDPALVELTNKLIQEMSANQMNAPKEQTQDAKKSYAKTHSTPTP